MNVEFCEDNSSRSKKCGISPGSTTGNHGSNFKIFHQVPVQGKFQITSVLLLSKLYNVYQCCQCGRVVKTEPGKLQTP